MKKIKKIVAILLFVSLVTPCLIGLNVSAANTPETAEVKEDHADTTSREQSNTTYMYSTIDDLQREVKASETTVNGKEVGVFYHVWHGTFQQGDVPYDTSKIVENLKKAGYLGKNSPELTDEAWIAAGGGHSPKTATDGMGGDSHWWGTPLFGYYRAIDRWVVERDVQMLTDAGVDFIALDYTNPPRYIDQLLILMQSLQKYAQQGYDVPKVTFYTFEKSAIMVEDLYERVYTKHPEFKDLWYQMSGKPLMIGTTTTTYTDDDGVKQTYNLSAKAKSYFTFRAPRLPSSAAVDTSGSTFPWMADKGFVQNMYTDANGTKKSVISVSVAQHLGSKAFSDSAFYGDTTNHTRSYHNGKNDTGANAYLYGYNFAEQFEYAIKKNPDIIFITGWNEWVATRLNSGEWTYMDGTTNNRDVILVDSADINNSRDIQPMSGGYGDNYYMQMISYIRKFKGNATVNANLNTAAKVLPAELDGAGVFEQWDEVDSYYLDYAEDNLKRSGEGYGKGDGTGVTVYTDTTGRNDIYKMKVANDKSNVYFYAETVSDIEGVDASNCMSLYLNSGSSTNPKWENNYDFAIGRLVATKDGIPIEKYNGSGWDVVGYATYKRSGNKMQLEVPFTVLGYTTTNFTLNFKWADNCDIAEGMDTFYLHGDAAPYGRLNYVYKGVAGEQYLSYGDVNIDKQGVDSRDLVRLKNGLRVGTQSADNDLNRDSSVDEKDIFILRKILLGSLKQQDVHIQETQAKIVSYKVSNTWGDDRTKGTSADPNGYLTVKPEMSYDGDLGTRWNPSAKDWNYSDKPYIVYTLEQYHDLDEISMIFDKNKDRQYYFDIEVSTDGIEFKPVAQVTKDNFKNYYDNSYTCTAYVNAEDARYVKIIFTGDTNNSAWVSLHEVKVYGNVSSECKVDSRELTKTQIESAQILGTWGDSAATTIYRTYDNNASGSFWNPRVTNYTSGEGVIYTLSKATDLSKLQLTFAVRRHYFDVHVSEDGQAYEKLVSVNADTLSTYYKDGFVCTIDNLQKSNIKYIKIMFTGNTGRFDWNENFREIWLALHEVEVYGQTSQRAIITEGNCIGRWSDEESACVTNSYDDNTGTKWSPSATNYTFGEGVVYTLRSAYDLSKLQLTFGARYYHFKMSVSTDGTKYTKVATVGAGNQSAYYTDGYICTLDNLALSDVKYIKIEFTGTSDGAKEINLFEVAAYGVESTIQINIKGSSHVGTWANKYAGTYVVANSYDKDAETFWNATVTDYASGEGIVYTLDDIYDLTELQLAFGKRYYYFKVSGSVDGKAYTEIATVNAENQRTYYTDNYVCTLDNLKADNVRYLKIEFTGSSENNTPWLILNEVAVLGKKSIVQTAITAGVYDSNWSTVDGGHIAHAYDNDVTSVWNPSAKSGYTPQPSVAYTLDRVYDIRKLQFTFGNRYMYFKVYGSEDGVKYTEIATVDKGNQDTCYTEEKEKTYVCTLDNLVADHVKYLKLEFTGSSDGGTWLSVYEVKAFGMTCKRADVQVSITEGNHVGTWVNKYAGANVVANGYDNDIATFWNAQVTNCASGEGIVYTLDDSYDLTKLRLAFGTRYFYFKVSVSSDGVIYTDVANVDAKNQSLYYTYYSKGNVCTVNNLNANNVKYIKIEFTGSSDNGVWLSLYDIAVFGTEPVEQATISNGSHVGTWANKYAGENVVANGYDNNDETFWNAAVTDYDSGEGIVYSLERAYDLTKLKLTFGKRYFFFKISGSADGATYSDIATVNSGNQDLYYTYGTDSNVCILDNLTLDDVKYIKIEFTGSNDGSTWLSLYEVAVLGTKSVMQATITQSSHVGTWVNKHAGTNVLENSYDDNNKTFWNATVTDYASGEGIVYTLDDTYDLTKLQLTFGNRNVYFKLSGSSDGVTYNNIANVNSENQNSYYKEGYVCTLDNLKGSNVKYVKIEFTGSNDKGTWISLYEAAAFGIKSVTKATITQSSHVGTWANKYAGENVVVNSYDNNDETFWNATVTDYASGEGIVYTLDGTYDLTKLQLTFGKRYHYFKILGSADGVTYSNIATVNSQNQDSYYTYGTDNNVCTLDNLKANNVKYIKIEFTGSNDGGTWLSLYEAAVLGRCMNNS